MLWNCPSSLSACSGTVLPLLSACSGTVLPLSFAEEIRTLKGALVAENVNAKVLVVQLQEFYWMVVCLLNIPVTCQCFTDGDFAKPCVKPKHHRDDIEGFQPQWCISTIYHA